jgi:hypothetical protein
MEPFRFFQSFDIPENFQGQLVEFTVPADKLLHIEFIAGDVTLPAGESSFIAVSIQIHDTTGATIGLYSVSSHELGNIGVLDLFEFGQLVSVYADPGTKVTAQVNRFGTGTLGAGGVNMSISGQLFTV